MDVQSLQAFVAVARLQSFSNAAEELHLTQPAISKRIAGLEDSLKTPLFDRVGRQILLTEAGKTLYARAHDILRSIEDAQRAITNLSKSVSGKLKIGTSHHVGLHRLPPILRAYKAKYPEVTLDIQFLESEKVCQTVLSGELEMGIATLPSFFDELSLLDITWPDPMSICVSASHPLAKYKDNVSIEAIANYESILPSKLTFTYKVIKQAFQKADLELKVGMTTNYLETIKMMVSIGLGWSALPDTMIDGELVKLNVQGINVQRQLGVITHKKRELSNPAKAFYALIKETKPQNMGSPFTVESN